MENDQYAHAPNEDQLSAIKTFAEKHGRNWKEVLRAKWANGTDANEQNGHLLRQVRNQFGPVWLNEFTIKSRGMRP